MLVFSDSDVQHKLNLGITSPMFTDLRLLYDAQRDHVNVSVSTPSSGFFGLQLDCRDPSQMSARFYGRSPVSFFYKITTILRFKKTDCFNIPFLYADVLRN